MKHPMPSLPRASALMCAWHGPQHAPYMPEMEGKFHFKTCFFSYLCPKRWDISMCILFSTEMFIPKLTGFGVLGAPMISCFHWLVILTVLF
jgi:hypothetical protein